MLTLFKIFPANFDGEMVHVHFSGKNDFILRRLNIYTYIFLCIKCVSIKPTYQYKSNIKQYQYKSNDYMRQ